MGERLLKNPAFRRGWITQEIALAPLLDMCSSNARMDFDCMYTAIVLKSDLLLPENNEAIAGYSWFDSVSPSRAEVQAKQIGNLGLAFLFERTRDLHFSDARDKVYGLLALHRAGKGTARKMRIKADYNAGISEAYWQATETYCSKNENSSSLLSSATPTFQTTDGLRGFTLLKIGAGT